MAKHDLILWDEDNNKWQDVHNDYFCAQKTDGTGWRVSARYGFPDGSSTKEFDTEQAAMTYFVNFLHDRIMQMTVEGYERRASRPLSAPMPAQ